MEIYSHYNGKLGLICFAIYLVMLIRGRRAFSGKTLQSNNYWFVFICMLLYSGLGFLEWDTYHYYLIYDEMVSFRSKVYVEPFFYWLIVHLPKSYLLWRFVVWGASSALMVLAAKKLSLNANVFCFMVPLLFLTRLSVTRGALGLALMVFCSIVFIQSLQKKNVFLLVFCLFGLFASIFLHNSMIFFVLLLVFSYFLPLNKGTFVASLIVFPFLYTLAVPFLQDFSFFNLLDEEQIQILDKYATAEQLELNTNGIIMSVFTNTFLLLLVFNMAKKYVYDNIEASKEQLFIFKYAYVLVYVSFLFLGQNVSSWISNRSLHAASFALVLCATQCFDTTKVKHNRTLLEKIILVGLFIQITYKQMDFILSNWK